MYVLKCYPRSIRKGRMRISFEIVDTGVEPVTYSFEGNRSTSELIMYASEYTETRVTKPNEINLTTNSAHLQALFLLACENLWYAPPDLNGNLTLS